MKIKNLKNVLSCASEASINLLRLTHFVCEGLTHIVSEGRHFSDEPSLSDDPFAFVCFTRAKTKVAQAHGAALHTFAKVQQQMLKTYLIFNKEKYG